MILHINTLGTFRLYDVACDTVVVDENVRRGRRPERVLRNPAAICGVWKAAAYSASPIDAIKILITELYTVNFHRRVRVAEISNATRNGATMPSAVRSISLGM